MASSFLICNVCECNIADCSCPDQDAKLKGLAMDPRGPIAFKWCRTCDKHFARCKCEVPDFYVVLGGKEVPVPRSGFRSGLDGSRYVPDLTER